MKDLSYQQKIASMRILLDIIHADGRVDARETFFFNKLKAEFGMTDEDHKVVEEKNSILALSQIKCLDEEQKEYFAELMSRMIVIDENVNVNEVNIYNIVCESCGIGIKFNDILTQNEFKDVNLTCSDTPHQSRDSGE